MKYGRYEILKELGHGAMGVVYQAHDPRIDRPVALKVLRSDRVTSQDFVQRFLKEARAIGRLSHANIVTVYDVGQDQGTIYIAMEYLEGRPLNETVREKPLTIRQTVDIAQQVAKALDYAHARGIVHRDIKPSNIILGGDGRVKITDFGIARIEDPEATQQTRAGEILGTPVYMSPEQVMGQTVDGRSDLYSLGVILYEMTTARRPFAGENLAVIFNAITHDVPRRPRTADGPLPPALADLIMKSLAKVPEERFQSGEAMASALGVCLKSDDPPKIPPTGKPSASGLALRIGLMVAILLAGAAFFYVKSGPPGKPDVPPAPLPAASVQAVAPPGIRAPSGDMAGTEKSVNEAGATPVVQPPQNEVQSRLPALLKVDSLPTGAQVFIDDAFKGKTPLALDLPAGKYEVLVTLRGYYEWEARIELDSSGETPLYVRLVATEE